MDLRPLGEKRGVRCGKLLVGGLVHEGAPGRPTPGSDGVWCAAGRKGMIAAAATAALEEARFDARQDSRLGPRRR
ncbi:hypothetical protein [Streptomyces sp. SP17KL33]|uniref:hypothetical protein n=1 Tax=Streptomyces sp. SP17KL33 TaxID=3002534 RepID=UPI002E79213B|nr:hypothetical protein [Streptomyces sp. SP17KL33]MEE1832179.1 hypothetical protein [Streptomyces sp. SP17KL33]